ncbi:MAG: type II toxin-antitoxin system VapC family toxin [Micrococcales bacterium]|nr:type II toxin-antitoxin system VapC family toxin [Micrococcales bacterium]
MALVYFDTTALLTLCVPELGDRLTAELWEGADAAVTSRYADVELRAAIADHFRAGTLPRARAALEEWDRLWAGLYVVEPTGTVLDEAASLVVRHPLGAPAAVHLASALTLRADDLLLVCWDQDLAAAARAEGLRVEPAP